RFLFGRSEAFQGTPGENDRGKKGFNNEATAECLHQQHQLDGAAAQSAIFFHERQGSPTQLGKGFPDPLAVSLFAFRDALPLGKAVLVVDEARDALGKHRLFVLEGKIHRVLASRRQRFGGMPGEPRTREAPGNRRSWMSRCSPMFCPVVTLPRSHDSGYKPSTCLAMMFFWISFEP